MRVASNQVSRPFQGDTLKLFCALGGQRPDTVLLESMDGSGKNNVQSLLFVGNALRIEARANCVEVVSLSPNGSSALLAMESPLRGIGDVVKEEDRLNIQFPFPKREGTDRERIEAKGVIDVVRLLGRVLMDATRDGDETVFLPGVFAYDFIDTLEELPQPKEDVHAFPDYVFWLPEKTIVVDHVAETATALVWRYGDAETDDQGEVLSRMVRQVEAFGKQKSSTTRPPVGVSGDFLEHVDLSDGEFAALVERLKSHIVAGDVFQIVPSRAFSMPCPDPVAAYEELRQINPSPYMFFLNGPDFCLFGASPESCVSVRGTPRALTLRPIAGTRPRGFLSNGEIDRDLDNRLEAELKLDEKELAEHMMLVDLARNDVARMCKEGTRHVLRLLEVERYSHVMHLVSAVEGTLRDRYDALHAYRGSMNMGTLVGAPKIEAARLLRKYEGSKRGPYGGAVGYFTSKGELDTAIIIRSALVKDGRAHVRAGAGVVFDSDPKAETTETRNKAKAVLLAIERAKNSRHLDETE